MIVENSEQTIGNRDKEHYDEDTDYYYNNALKINIKADSGSTKPRGRIPIWKLKLEDECDIPEKPNDILEKPNDKHYEKLLKEQDDLIAFHNKSIEDLKAKIKKERTGNNPEIAKLQEEKTTLKEVFDPLVQKVKSIETKLDGPRKELANLKSNKEFLAKEIDVFKIETLNNEIKNIQHKLGFSSLSIGEEKKLIDRKARLEAQKPKVIKYSEIMKKIQEIHDRNNKEFDELKTLKDKKKGLQDKLTKIKTKLDDFYQNKKNNDPVINNLIAQKQNIHEEINKCYEKKREMNKEWDNKWYKYENQQKLLSYIKEAQDKINMLKKKEEKERKRKEKEAQESNDVGNGQDFRLVKEENTLLAYQIWVCDWLISYFNNLTGENNTNSEVVHNTQPLNSIKSKIDEDISKGLIKPINRQAIEDEFSIGISGSNKGKKKTKAPKISKREQKLESNTINIDITIINKIKDVNRQLTSFILSPPVVKTELPKFIAQLREASQILKLRAANITNEIESNDENFHPDEVAENNSTSTKVNPDLETTNNVENFMTIQGAELNSSPKKVNTAESNKNDFENKNIEISAELSPSKTKEDPVHILKIQNNVENSTSHDQIDKPKSPTKTNNDIHVSNTETLNIDTEVAEPTLTAHTTNKVNPVVNVMENENEVEKNVKQNLEDPDPKSGTITELNSGVNLTENDVKNFQHTIVEPHLYQAKVELNVTENENNHEDAEVVEPKSDTKNEINISENDVENFQQNVEVTEPKSNIKEELEVHLNDNENHKDNEITDEKPTPNKAKVNSVVNVTKTETITNKTGEDGEEYEEIEVTEEVEEIEEIVEDK